MARRVLGDAFVTHYVHTRRHEIQAFQQAITDWELSRYMEMV
jgi:glutamine synthetase